MQLIKNQGDAKKLKLGDSYFIDVFPPAEKEDQTITEKMLDKRDKLQAFIDKHLAADKKQKKER